jgi:hypothetical protein
VLVSKVLTASAAAVEWALRITRDPMTTDNQLCLMLAS